MKNNKKFILAAGAAALGLVAATGATSGFAWFTTNRTVNAAFNSVNVSSNAASLVIANNASLQNEGDNKSGNSITGVAPIENHNVTDVSSGDGLEFKVPTKDASGALIGESVVPNTGVVSTGLYAYVDYNFWIGQVTAQANTLDVYLSTITIEINNTGTDLGGAARAALFVGDTVVAGNRKLIVNSGSQENQTYLSFDAQGHASTNTNIVAASTLLATQVDTQAEAAPLTTRKMLTTDKNAATKLTLRVWFEGTNFTDQEFPATAPTVTTSISFVAFDTPVQG